MTQGRFEILPDPAPRLEAEPAPVPAPPPPRWGTPGLMLAGLLILVFGFALLGAINFITDQFARSVWLGAVTAAVALLGFGLMAASLLRELLALRALAHVDHLRGALASGDAARVTRAARDFAATLPERETLEPALRVLNDPDAALALLRAGPGRRLRDEADALSRAAIIQTVAGIAAMPGPRLDMLLVIWRGTRLIRQIASLYGLRPGLLATLSLLRRTALSATMVGAAELAGNSAAHAVLGSPYLAKFLGDAAGAGIAARRMLVLGRAAAAACDPIPPE